MKTQNVPVSGFLRLPQILATVAPVGRTTLWRWVASGKFPKPVKLSDKVTAWRRCDVQAWADRQGADKSEAVA